MLSNSVLDIEEDKMEWYEKVMKQSQYKENFKILATNYEEQTKSNDLFLYPGKMGIDLCK